MRFFVFLIGLITLVSPTVFAADIPREEIGLPGLREKVAVTYDDFGIPHIRAGNERDLYFVQGYVQARDRLWQMDLARRKATARMAELFGEEAIDTDIDTLNTQIPQVSRKIWEGCDEEMKNVLQAFADGVNAYIKNMEEPPEEYSEIGAEPAPKPAPWHPVDSIAFGRLMSWRLSSDLGREIRMGEVMKVVGKKLFMEIAPFHGADPITIVEWEKSAQNFPEELFQTDPSENWSRPLFASGRMSGGFPGSNNWVVGGSRTESGFPILSNDPHLGLGNPPIWYEIHLTAPGLNVVGSTFPATPGVIIGHNERIAWGVTTTGYDVTDVYVETPDPDRPDTHYMHRGESLPFEEEKLEVRYKTGGGIKVKEHTILHTVHGPVVRDSRPHSVLSYRWTGHEPTYELRCFYEANRARGLDDFKKALAHFRVGAQSFVYADVEGNIFFKAPADVPIREGLAFLPLDGSSGEYEWTGYIPFDELPHAENPAKGYVATANNRPVDDAYPHYVGAFFDKGYRARRITDRIEAAGNRMTFAEMQSIQADVHSLPGERLAPLLFAAAEKHPEILTTAGRKALEVLRKWNFKTDTEIIGSSIFHKWLKHCVTNIFSDDYPDYIVGHTARSENFFPFLLSEDPPPLDWYDDKRTDEKETKEMILARSLNDAAAELAKQFGEDMVEWRWGRLHKLTLGHRLGGRFNIGPFEVDGALDTVDNAGFGLMGDDFNFGGGPSLRMTVELRPGAVRGENVIPGGQEARTGSPHHKDQMELWLRNEARPMWLREEDIKGATGRIVVFSP